MSSREYGGYIELEQNCGQEYHEQAVALNCGRNCLAYLLETQKIEKILIPYFLCTSVLNVCKKCGTDVEFYHIDDAFHPILPEKLKDNQWLYLVNYYGQFPDEELLRYRQKYQNLIVDNAQAFFQMPVPGTDTIYTCRKFFGVPDGAYLYTDAAARNLETDLSYERMHFLLGRYEKTAGEFYGEYVANNHVFATEPVKAMSKLTHNLLRGIDYERVSRIRTGNFAYLHETLAQKNPLKLTVPQGAFMYPLYVENGKQIRSRLQQEKIFIPTLWPDVFTLCDQSSIEYRMAQNILPIPVDQRYTVEDMQYIVSRIFTEL